MLATDCNREPRPAYPYIMRWDGVVVAYTIDADEQLTTTVLSVARDTAGKNAGRRELETLFDLQFE